ncbi:hypothetical protein K443DRAFT_671237 [Laccaria amethystina LaAM-08-1]|jgi:uncharacterized Zn-finger protein|uniref:C2H2-type domain-containing protein n=1 Tax=Laccaria amethystina LaAM-08-1 TaxID=1095629 RepID=A0A0C9YHY1_9AGAR|nr:hypothetical protein K443DRAFT_671237 [Laccaria amethystina LaAM-08-1]
MSADSLPRQHFDHIYAAVAGPIPHGVPIPQGVPTEGPATHPDGPPRDYSYAQHPMSYTPPPPHSPIPASSTMILDHTSPKRDPFYAPNAAELYNRAQQLSVPPSPSVDSPIQSGAGANHYPSASGVPRLPPILQVEKQQVTTSATQLASASRRRNEAHFVCPVPGCGSTFTRRFNLRGHLRSHTEERPYVCDWPGCKKGFARQHDCKRHQALHTAKSSQSNVCQGCKKTFSRLDALNRHLRSDGGAECRASNPKFASDENQSNNASRDQPVQQQQQ